MNPVSLETNETFIHSEDAKYEAPQVETVLTSEEMEREILYAGGGGTQFR